ncbi:MAG: hypothetical protein ARM1_0518 [Candidatus Micrarchaeota archaeon]|nr:MAG: hypothetical protein ARM1_0518 [Candidatus Micrarchaeota archaeon]
MHYHRSNRTKDRDNSNLNLNSCYYSKDAEIATNSFII